MNVCLGLRVLWVAGGVYDNFKCPYEKSHETYRMHLV